MSYISIDIDLEEIYYQLSSRDKQYLTNRLADDGYIEKESNQGKPDSLGQQMFIETCQKLTINYYQLTREQIEQIEQITNNL